MGIFYPLVLLGAEAEPPGLEPIIGHPEFEVRKEMHSNRYRESMEKALPILTTIKPEPPPKSLPPLQAALHRNVSNKENESNFHHSGAEKGWLLAMPQSTHP